jgi:hypothetical protein
MDHRLVVGGLIARNAVLSTLLLNYADRLEKGSLGHGAATAPSFIVPIWSVGRFPYAPIGNRLLTVEAHTSSTDPRCQENLDTILRLLHVVLTDDHASSSITARRLSTTAGLRSSGPDTVVKAGTWDVALVPSRSLRAAPRRLLPWPDCSTSVIATGPLTPRAIRLN